jgi:hypothetical protein
MIFGMSIYTFTLLHTAISLIGIVTGLSVLYGMLNNNRLDTWTAVFLASTVLTSATGFAFPFTRLLPSHIFGIISLVVLVPVILALYSFKLAGVWRLVYIIGALFTLYLNCFVAVVQAFLKIPAVKALAPTQAEPPFAIAQGLLLIAFLALGYLAVKRFRPAMIPA